MDSRPALPSPRVGKGRSEKVPVGGLQGARGRPSSDLSLVPLHRQEYERHKRVQIWADARMQAKSFVVKTDQ